MKYFSWRNRYDVYTFRIDSMSYLTRIYSSGKWMYHCGNAWDGWRELQFNLG